MNLSALLTIEHLAHLVQNTKIYIVKMQRYYFWSMSPALVWIIRMHYSRKWGFYFYLCSMPLVLSLLLTPLETKGSTLLSDIDLLHCFFLHLLISTNAGSPITRLQQTFTAVWNPHTHYADDRERERERERATKPKTYSERLQLKFFSHAKIEPNELWQNLPPLAAGVSNQLWETSLCEHYEWA